MQIFNNCLEFFRLDLPFCKHTEFSKVNAFWKFGIDFFQPSAAIFFQNEHKHLYASRLAKPLKTRVFSAKNILAQNFQNMEGLDCSFSEIELTKIQKRP